MSAPAHDQQGRRQHALQGRPGQVRPAAAGNHRPGHVGPLRRGHQRRPRPGAGSEQPIPSSRPKRAASQSMAPTRRRASRPMSKRSSRLRRSSCFSSAVSRSISRVPRWARCRWSATRQLRAVAAATAAVGEQDDPTAVRGPRQVAVKSRPADTDPHSLMCHDRPSQARLSGAAIPTTVCLWRPPFRRGLPRDRCYRKHRHLAARRGWHAWSRDKACVGSNRRWAGYERGRPHCSSAVASVRWAERHRDRSIPRRVIPEAPL